MNAPGWVPYVLALMGVLEIGVLVLAWRAGSAAAAEQHEDADDGLV